MTTLQTDIEQRLAASDPEVEVLLAEVVGGRQLRVFIDHPQGVTLQLCEHVSAQLSELRERYSLEVSSPGVQRPLTKPAHYRRFVGHRVRVRVRASYGAMSHEAVPYEATSCEAAQATSCEAPREERDHPRSNFTGELISASDQEVTLAATDGIVTIPYTEIRRCNLVEE